jgi:hypothetical protein
VTGTSFGANKLVLLSIAGLFVAALFMSLAFDGRLHWDEPAFLYTGGYLSVDQILHGSFTPSGIEGFNQSRILHILLIHMIVMVLGLGMDALVALIVFYLILLVTFSYVTFLILKELLPQQRGLGIAVVVSMFVPLYLYLAFKTLPETPALLLAGIATLGLIGSMRERTALWLAVTAFSLAGMALFKSSMALLYLAFIVACLLYKRQQYPPIKLVRHAVISGVASLTIFYVALLAMRIEVGSFLDIASSLAEKPESLVSRVLHVGLEGGVFYLALPLAFLSQRKRAAAFFLTWFLVATLPLVLLFQHVEARYLAPNLVAFSGLICLTLEGITHHFARYWRRGRLFTASAGVLILASIVISDFVGLMIMSHEVRMDQLHKLLRRVDQMYSDSDYAVLTPWSYTDFHYRRFVYPERQVYNVYNGELGPFEDYYYGGRMIRTLDQLVRISSTHLVYLGFEENHSVANLAAIIRTVLGTEAEALFDTMTFSSFSNHLSLSWMWNNPTVVLQERVRYGHYIVYDVEIHQSAQSRILPNNRSQ